MGILGSRQRAQIHTLRRTTNCVPLSERTCRGIPCLANILESLLTTVVAVVSGRSSDGKFQYAPYTTRYDLPAHWQRSTPTRYYGWLSVGRIMIERFFWLMIRICLYVTQWLIIFWISDVIPGQNINVFAFSLHLAMPRCPLSALLSISFRSVLGMTTFEPFSSTPFTINRSV